MKKYVTKSVIWNITSECCWDCKFCCMDCKKDYRPEDELSLSEKLNLVDNLKEIGVRVDISGGEPFVNYSENIKVIEKASHLLGKENIGISCSGAFIDEKRAIELAKLVNDVEITLDCHPDLDYDYRPAGYHRTAAKSLKLLKSKGLKVSAQTVLTKANCDKDMLVDLYNWLCSNQIDCWSILRFFAAGRGKNHPDLFMTTVECKEVVRLILEIDKESNNKFKPSIDFHYLMPGHGKYTKICRCVKKSIGILPNGLVTSCFWALDDNQKINNDIFYLGMYPKETLADMLSNSKSAYWLQKEHVCAHSGMH